LERNDEKFFKAATIAFGMAGALAASASAQPYDPMMMVLATTSPMASLMVSPMANLTVS